ncbi:YebC/PmpR family DNA-binding transcriptional regulator [Candidatus Cerribacteria bacterium 'Amazon FNV 2010 28 9']|uniref:YebC/PmpR family DNA-binding transcriptional regulator n=1 Tax=Candidatus Cerribacteria bacterium 'Amazon FNV 2010 28 9' TaxID=2081795 RepID=A0A317JT85_9BACT|nr:MAG: YebC/PmpR family DNA-binding transcriptional regulator [Candidatus Cerribacteria bacterium 'Amazon FNV 2010 28 9']
MSGHSKWNNIKNKKAATDAKKSKEFTQIAKLIMSAVKKTGVGDPNENPSLRLALDKAHAVNMPNANIKRAIDRALGKGEQGALEEILYEGYGPNGVGIIALAHTDNKQRTGGEVRYLFSSYEGALAGPGAAMYLFANEDGEYIPTIPVVLTQEQYTRVMELIDELENHDDIDAVWHNAVLGS